VIGAHLASGGLGAFEQENYVVLLSDTLDAGLPRLLALVEHCDRGAWRGFFAGVRCSFFESLSQDSRAQVVNEFVRGCMHLAYEPVHRVAMPTAITSSHLKTPRDFVR
jgi:hypothetical protein